MVPVYMMTNNYSLHILKASVHFFNKYWSEKIRVKVLGFKHPSFKLPDNFEFVSLGKQESFSFTSEGKRLYYWTNSITPFIRDEAEDCFVLIWDEHLIIRHVAQLMFAELFNDVYTNKAQKAILSTVLNKGKFCYGIDRYRDDIVKLHQKTQYRTTLMPSIWRKEYILQYMKPNMTAWEFERVNIPKSQRDGAVIIAPRNRDTVEIFNVYVKGRFASNAFGKISSKLNKQDKNLIRRTAKKWIY